MSTICCSPARCQNLHDIRRIEPRSVEHCHFSTGSKNADPCPHIWAQTGKISIHVLPFSIDCIYYLLCPQIPGTAAGNGILCPTLPQPCVRTADVFLPYSLSYPECPRDLSRKAAAAGCIDLHRCLPGCRVIRICDCIITAFIHPVFPVIQGDVL